MSDTIHCKENEVFGPRACNVYTTTPTLALCFDDEEFISTTEAGKIKDVIALLKKKYTAAVADAAATGAGFEEDITAS